MPSERSVDLSIIVHARAEGHRLHATIVSVERADAHARAQGWASERLLVLHDPTAPTIAWVDHALGPDWRVIRCAEPDLGAARRAGCRAAAGRHAAILDGGDLWSETWLSAALAAATAADPAVWHPEAAIRFGRDFNAEQGYACVFHPDGVTSGYDYAAMLESNPYSPSWLAPRAVLDAVPFPREDAAKGWGHVDWWWACNVVGAGFHHRIVPETFHYQRIGPTGAPLLPAPLPPHTRIGPTGLARSPVAARRAPQ